MSLKTEHVFGGCFLLSAGMIVVSIITSLAVTGGVIVALYYLIKYLIKLNAGA